METVYKAIEVNGTIDERQQLHLDGPLPAVGPSRVRVIILLPQEEDIDEAEWLRAAASNPSFAFLRDEREDIYTVNDGKPFNDQG
jgi:hypothetical protein